MTELISYVLVVFATVLFSFQFLFNQKFQANNGTGMGPTLTFTLYRNAATVIIMFCIAGFRIEFYGFSMAIAAIYACNSVMMTYFSMKAFAVTNLSVYSVFTMLGGMFLPFVQGVAFYNEALTFPRILCCIMIALAVILTASKEKSDKRAVLYYALVFLFNGMSGVLSKIHQSSARPHTDSPGFMLWTGIFSMIMAVVLSALTGNSIPKLSRRDIPYVFGFGLFCGIGNLFLLISLKNLPSSVQYPIVTGGVMALSTVISILRKERVTTRSKIAAAIAFVASVFMAL